MSDVPLIQDLLSVSPCEYAEALPREQYIDPAIHQLWTPMPRIAGPAFTVKCGKGDHLSLHAAIYRAKPGDVLVVEADHDFASTGGNVCAVAKQRGVVAMIIDGLVRDIGEIRGIQFPVYARGVIPVPAAKDKIYPFNQPIQCGGVTVYAGDYIVADEDGIAVIPQAQLIQIYTAGKSRTDKDAAMDLAQWEKQHSQKIEAKLQALGFNE
ncbi:RraA family protein [Flavobacterium sp. W21_SRS_FM6]|uniref:RraA family protein n=1 Tax=Flavobacterium sp. W21_SRS_FM6 TaxID=3240268 RepID=UPI003F911322